MKKKQSRRARFIKEADLQTVAAWAWDAMMLVSTHDPEHEHRLNILERQTERLGAPQYRVVRKGKR